MTISITLNQTTGLNGGYLICSVIHGGIIDTHGNYIPDITTIAPESNVLFKQVESTPITTPIPFSFSDANITVGYYIEMIISPTINRADGQLCGGCAWPISNQAFSCGWGNGQVSVNCVITS